MMKKKKSKLMEGTVVSRGWKKREDERDIEIGLMAENWSVRRGV